MEKTHESKAEVDPVLDAEYLNKARSDYAGTHDLMNPLISPLFGDFQEFPPTYIQVGSNEILYSDAARLYKRMAAAKVTVKFESFEGMWHVFQMAPFKKAYQAMDKMAAFIFEICL